jgi:hypothetical protein
MEDSSFAHAVRENLSIASPIGFIALAGVSAEFGIVMLIYLDHAIEKRRAANKFTTERDLIEAIEEGAVLRVRPKAMTVAVIVAGLLPIMLGGGTGSEVMRRIAAPMVRRHDHSSVAIDACAAGSLSAVASAQTTALVGRKERLMPAQPQLLDTDNCGFSWQFGLSNALGARV